MGTFSGVHHPISGGGATAAAALGPVDIADLTPYAEEDTLSIRNSGTGLSGSVKAGAASTLVSNVPQNGILSLYDIPRDCIGNPWVQGSIINSLEARLMHNSGMLLSDGIGVYTGLAFSSTGTGTDGRPMALSEIDGFVGVGLMRQTASSLRSALVGELTGSIDGSQAETDRLMEVMSVAMRSPATPVDSEFRVGQMYAGSLSDASAWVAGAFTNDLPNWDVTMSAQYLVLFSMVFRYQLTDGIRPFAPLGLMYMMPGGCGDECDDLVDYMDWPLDPQAQAGVFFMGQSNADNADWVTIAASTGSGRVADYFGVTGSETDEWLNNPNYTDDAIEYLINQAFKPAAFVILWGEADVASADPAGFAVRAKAEIDRIRNSTGGGQNIYFVLLSGPGPTGWADVNPGMVALAAAEDDVFTVDSAGADKSDTVHYSAAGRQTIMDALDTAMTANGD